MLGSGSDGFTLTTGDPAAISSITGSFDGLTPVEEAPPVAPDNTLPVDEVNPL